MKPEGARSPVIEWGKPRADGRVVTYRIDKKADGATVSAELSGNPTFMWTFAPASITRAEVEKYFEKVVAEAP